MLLAARARVALACPAARGPSAPAVLGARLVRTTTPDSIAERRRYKQEVSMRRKQYADDIKQRTESSAAAKEAERAEIAERKKARLELKRQRIAENQRRVEAELAQARVELAARQRLSAQQALEYSAEHEATMATRVDMLALESAEFITLDNLDQKITPELFTRVASRVEDTPVVRRSPPSPDSGAAPDYELLQALGKERSADVPIWLRHTVVGPKREGAGGAEGARE